jgi:hypothetical protein
MRKIILLSVLFYLTFFAKGIAQEENFISLSVYSFTRFIDWPSSDGSGDFIIDVIGHKSVYDKLLELTAGRKVGNRNIVVRFLESVNNITQSQILFLGFWQSKDISKAIMKVGNAHTLIITEKEGLIDAGSAINFVIRNNTIKFEIKKSNIQKYGLSIDETLVNLACKIY